MSGADGDAEARAAILAVIARYCHAIDRRRWGLMEACFHADATYSFGPINGTWRDFVGAARAMIDPLAMTHHQIGQTILAAVEDGLDAETYFTATHRVPADAATDGVFDGRGHEYHAVMVGRYSDRFTCRAGAWRIARRVGVIDGRHDLVLTEPAPEAVGHDPASMMDLGA